MVLGLKRCLPGSMSDADPGFGFSDPKKQRNNDVLPGELDRCVVNSGFEGVGSCCQGFLARNPPESGFSKTAGPSRMECSRIIDSEESRLQPCPAQENRAEEVMPERVEVVCNDTEGVYFPGLHMVQCGCKSCRIKKNNTKRSVGDWEKHAGSRAKKWKVSIKLKATRQPLGEWVAEYSAAGFSPGLDSRRLSAFLSQKYEPVNEKWTAERCAVCRWIEDWDYNKMVICNKCEMAVHQECYGVSDIKDFTHWVCNACKNPSMKTECCLCPVKGGALKPCDVEPFWVHVICAWFRPEISFLNDKMEPAVGLMRVPPKTFHQTCQICNQTHGSCVQCCKCSNTYHSTCALRAGFCMELVNVSNKNGRSTNRLILHCDIHKPPNADSKIVIRTPNKSRNQEQPRAPRGSEPETSEPEPEPEPDQFSAARCRVYVRPTARKRAKREPVINTSLNYKKEAENARGFLSMPERLNHLQRTIKERICFGKSGIHGWGVFARRNLREGEVVAEYLGEIVRRSVADVRESRYKETGRDCYLFSISEEVVIDATMKGSLTRLFNHCCMPNCYSRIVNLREDDYRVVLMAKKDVRAGEELTFDYMFDQNEDYEPTAPCFCGAPNCRKFM